MSSRDDAGQQKRIIRWWVVPPENFAKLAELSALLQEDAEKMSEEEINALIDEELAEVRRERRETQKRS